MKLLIHLGVPPALPGGPKSLTIPGVWTGNAISETPNRELPSTRKGGFSMDEHKNLSHPKWMGKFDVVSSPTAEGQHCSGSYDSI